MRRKNISLFIILVLVLSVLPTFQTSQAQDSYQDLINNALSDLGLNCAIMDVNSLCVGYDRVETSFHGTPPNGYTSAAGSKTDLTTVDTIRSYAIDTSTTTIGIAALYVKTTNIPGALTDQTALLVTFGDVELTNAVDPSQAVLFDTVAEVTTTSSVDLHELPGLDAPLVGSTASGTVLQADAVTPNKAWVRVLYNSGIAWVSSAALNAVPDTLPALTEDSRTPFQAFTFRTGNNPSPSLDVPRDAIMVQSPEDVYIDIWANGHHIRMNGTLFLSTLADGRMQIIVTDGLATVYPDTVRGIRVQAGTSIILGSDPTDYEVQNLPVGATEFDVFQGTPDNVVNYTWHDIQIWEPSQIWPRRIVEVQIEGRVPFNPSLQTSTTFPLIPVDAVAGEALERLEWVPFEVGSAACVDWALFHSNRDSDWDVHELAVNGGVVNISQGAGSTDIMPAHSADGNYVAFATSSYLEGGWEIKVMSRGDAVPALNARMTFNTGDDLNPVWGPGNLIAWETSRDGNWNIYVFDVSTGEFYALTTDTANDINPFWLPDGNNIVYQSDSDGDWDIYQLNLETGELTALTSNDVEDVDPIISPDGNWLAWLQQDSVGVYNLWLMDLETGEVSQLTDMGVDVHAHVFAPDSSLISFDAKVDGDFEVFIVRLASGVITAVTNNEASQTSAYAADDRAPAFVCGDSGSLLYHSDIDADLLNPYTSDLYRVTLPADNGSAGAAQRLTVEPESYDQYPMANSFEERESKESRRPPHPFN